MMYYADYITITIAAKEVAGTTPTMVILPNGRKEAKISQYGAWGDTWQDAQVALPAYWQEQRSQAARRLRSADAKLTQAQGMTQA